MWKARIVEKNVEGYRAYKRICDNILGFVIGDEQKTRTYEDLIYENGKIFMYYTGLVPNDSERVKFDECKFLVQMKHIVNCGFGIDSEITVPDEVEVVEPRELLFLLQELGACDRLSWAPRPFKGSGDITKEYIFLFPKSPLLAPSVIVPLIPICAFCGFDGPEILSVTEGLVSIPSPESAKYHFDECPLVWIGKNFEWNTKRYLGEGNEPSKFGHALKILQNSTKSMTKEAEWNEFTKLTSLTKVPGACETTLLELYGRLVEMKLERVEQLAEVPRHPLFYVVENNSKHLTRPKWNRPLAYLLAQTLDSRLVDSRNPDHATFVMNELRWEMDARDNGEVDKYVKRLLANRETPIVPESTGDGVLKYMISAEITRRAEILHGFVVIEACNSNNFNVHYRRDNRLCIFCGYSYTFRLCDYRLVNRMYSCREQRKIANYLMSKSPTGLPLALRKKAAEKKDRRYRKPTSGVVISLRQLFVGENGKTRASERKLKGELSREERLAVWLSASLNNSHAWDCIFRMKKQVPISRICPVCHMTEGQVIPVFTCGHALCDACVNDVHILDCPVCKNGFRKTYLRMKTE